MFKFYQTTVGKKLVMAISGMVLFIFVLGHMLGNLKIFQGLDAQTGEYKIDIYGKFLREVGYPLFGHGELLWIVRGILLLALLLHVLAAIQLTLTNKKSRGQGYALQKQNETTYAARTMRLTGILLLFYIVYHILHFTTGQVHFQGFEHGKVYANAVSSFRVLPIVLVYVVSMVLLCFHLYHGVWSGFQTMGLAERFGQKTLQILSKLIAVLILIGYISVPLAAYFGMLKPPQNQESHQLEIPLP